MSASCRVNGRAHPIAEADTVAAVLERLDISCRYALVERNGEPVPREEFGSVVVADGDKLVVARPVAGG